MDANEEKGTRLQAKCVLSRPKIVLKKVQCIHSLHIQYGHTSKTSVTVTHNAKFYTLYDTENTSSSKKNIVCPVLFIPTVRQKL